MYAEAQLALKYIHYYLTASNSRGHGMHSPFVFEFITKVLNDGSSYPAYQQVESLRQELMKNQALLQIDDLGAGSVMSKTNQRSIASIAKNAAKSKKFGQLLFRIAQKYQPHTIIELGTSLGISSSYLALGNPSAKIITIEGASPVAAIAEENFKKLKLENISVRKGNFDETLPIVLNELSAIDLCFIDGNHRQEPTERYFRQLLPKIHNESILIFDDIHWSQEMEEAWATVRSHPSVRCTIDLFFIGIVFFRQEFKEKLDFKVRF